MAEDPDWYKPIADKMRKGHMTRGPAISVPDADDKAEKGRQPKYQNAVNAACADVVKAMLVAGYEGWGCTFAPMDMRVYTVRVTSRKATRRDYKGMDDP